VSRARRLTGSLQTFRTETVPVWQQIPNSFMVVSQSPITTFAASNWTPVIIPRWSIIQLGHLHQSDGKPWPEHFIYVQIDRPTDRIWVTIRAYLVRRPAGWPIPPIVRFWGYHYVHLCRCWCVFAVFLAPRRFLLSGPHILLRAAVVDSPHPCKSISTRWPNLERNLVRFSVRMNLFSAWVRPFSHPPQASLQVRLKFIKFRWFSLSLGEL
jgi:hypothetical protein